jgi:hypothetical protein
MEVYYEPRTWDWDREVVQQLSITRFVEECEKQRKRSLEQKHENFLEDDVQLDYDERVELGKGMLRYYFKDVAPEVDKGWRPVYVELEFMVPIPDPRSGEMMWCKCRECWRRVQAFLAKAPADLPPEYKELPDREAWKGLPVVYAGRIDMLAQAPDGGYWIFDWKTARSISEQYQFLYLDDQIASYVWALKTLGLDVRGFIYHEQRKGFPQKPVKNKVRRLGRIFSVNKNQEVDYESYLKAVTEEDAEAHAGGLYDEMLTYLKEEGVTFFFRHQVHKSDAENRQTALNIGYEALEMTNDDLVIYPSPGRFGCNFCAFQTPCMEKNAEGDFQYALDTLYEVREHYYLREQSSTESKGAM